MKIKEFRDEYRWLSNFIGGVEQKYQAAKCKHEEDAQKILRMKPGEAKRAGRKVEMRENWEEIKLTVMEDLLRSKFNSEPFRTNLIKTGNMEIIEGNTWGDKFWGVDLQSGIGENHLGKLIMKIRSELQQQEN